MVRNRFVVIRCDLDICLPFECVAFGNNELSLEVTIEQSMRKVMETRDDDGVNIFLLSSASFRVWIQLCALQSPDYVTTNNVDYLINCYDHQCGTKILESGDENSPLNSFFTNKLSEVDTFQQTTTDIENNCTQIILKQIGILVDGFTCQLLSLHSFLFPCSTDRKVSLFYAGNFAPIHSNHVRILCAAVEMLKKLKFEVVRCYVYVGSDEYCFHKLSLNMNQSDRASLVSIALKNTIENLSVDVICGKACDSFEDVSWMPKKLEKELTHTVINLVGGDAFRYLHERYGKSICVNDPSRSDTHEEDYYRPDVILLQADFPRFSSTQFRSMLQQREYLHSKIETSRSGMIPDAVLHSISSRKLFPELQMSSQTD